MSTISSLGVGSGIDVRGLVDQLVAAEREPWEKRLTSRQQDIETQISGLGRLKEGLSQFGSVAADLKYSWSFRGIESKVSDEGVLSADAQSNAPVGNYEVRVDQLAQSQRLTTNEDLFGADFSPGTTSLGAGDVTLTYADGSTETFTLTEEADTLQDLRAMINAESDKARAEVVDDGTGYRMVLTTTGTGEENAIAGIGVSNADPAALLNELAFDAASMDGNGTSGGFTQLRASQDAVLFVDGLQITRSTNQVADAIDGVRLELTDVGTTRVSVTEKDGVAKEAIQGFVEAYNSLRATINELGAYDPETGESGLLNGDATLRGVQTNLARTLGEAVEGMDGGIRALADLGISTRRDGTLELDEQKLNEALATDPEAVEELFTRADTGVGARMDSVVKQYTGWDSILNIRNQSLQDRLEGIDEEWEDLNRRMDRYESRMIAQFSAMDAQVASLNKTSEFLDNQLAALNSGKK